MINSLRKSYEPDRKRILVVEDNVMHSELLKIIIQSSYDVDIEVASNGDEAMEFISDYCPFDLVIMDIMIPKINGIDVLKEIRKINRAVPVYMVSALNDDKIIDMSFAEGADNYFTKPIKKESLRESVGFCLGIAPRA